ncbi:MAG TPA: hypothetical protein ENF16_02960 [Bacteroidetes bacterium]|nr:hypothetical protein [Bacteroidota bacterium]
MLTKKDASGQIAPSGKIKADLDTRVGFFIENRTSGYCRVRRLGSTVMWELGSTVNIMFLTPAERHEVPRSGHLAGGFVMRIWRHDGGIT